MAILLLAHHSPSPATQELLEAVLAGARHDQITGVEVRVRPALVCSEVEVLEADGYLLGTPANIGYMSGALKHLFDRAYYPCLEATRGRPFGLYVHGNQDTGGAVRSVEQVASALGWVAAADPVEVMGMPGQADREACTELGGTLAARLATGW